MEFDRLEIVHPNMAALSQTDKKQFALLRRCGLGASDSSVYMGVNIWTTVDMLITQKLSTELTEEEIAIGEKSVVRKGADLEPFILNLFSEFAGQDIIKPTPMYRIKKHPQLTINYDGIMTMGDVHIPVEAKMCSIYAEKHWNKLLTIDSLMQGEPKMVGGSSVANHIELAGKAYGIPPYYYTQVQQQMLGTGAPFCFFAVLFDKEWEFKVYKVFEDKFVQEQIINESASLWKHIQELKVSTLS